MTEERTLCGETDWEAYPLEAPIILCGEADGGTPCEDAPTDTELLLAMAADHEYRLCLLEMRGDDAMTTAVLCRRLAALGRLTAEMLDVYFAAGRLDEEEYAGLLGTIGA